MMNALTPCLSSLNQNGTCKCSGNSVGELAESTDCVRHTGLQHRSHGSFGNVTTLLRRVKRVHMQNAWPVMETDPGKALPPKTHLNLTVLRTSLGLAWGLSLQLRLYILAVHSSTSTGFKHLDVQAPLQVQFTSLSLEIRDLGFFKVLPTIPQSGQGGDVAPYTHCLLSQWLLVSSALDTSGCMVCDCSSWTVRVPLCRPNL